MPERTSSPGRRTDADRMRLTGPDRHVVISRVGFVSATPVEIRSGLMGWVTFVVNDTIAVDGVAFRRTRKGRPTLSFPSKRDRNGTDHAYVRPLDDRSRREVEGQVFFALGVDTDAEVRS